MPFAHPLTVRAGQYADLTEARVVVVAGGGDGVLATIPVRLTDAEGEALRRSANILREAITLLNPT